MMQIRTKISWLLPLLVFIFFNSARADDENWMKRAGLEIANPGIAEAVLPPGMLFVPVFGSVAFC
jgi:hypothetical protein